MALTSLVPFQGPKKSQFSGPTPSNGPCNDATLLKTFTYRAIKTTGTLIVRNGVLSKGGGGQSRQHRETVEVWENATTKEEDDSNH